MEGFRKEEDENNKHQPENIFFKAGVTTFFAY